MTKNYLEPKPISKEVLEKVKKLKLLTDEVTDVYGEYIRKNGDSVYRTMDVMGLNTLKVTLGTELQLLSRYINELELEDARQILLEISSNALIGVMWIDSNKSTLKTETTKDTYNKENYDKAGLIH